MKFASIVAAMALALPVAVQAAETHSITWHPSGKTPAAIQQPREKRVCVEAADHHRGSKGPVTPVVRCSKAAELAQRTPQSVERGE